MRIGCQIGIWRDKSLEEAIAATGSLGLAGLEVFEWHIAAHYGNPQALQTSLQRAGVQLSGVYFTSDDFINPAGEGAVLKKASQACAFLRAVGAGFLVMNGGVQKKEGAAFSDRDFGQLAKVANRIGAEAGEKGIAAVMHPHAGCMVEAPQDVDRLLEAGLERSEVGLCVHAGHQLAIGADPYELYEKHASWVRYAHIGDSDAEQRGALLGEGVLDQRRLMEPLLAAGFDGWIIIECAEEGVAPEEYAARARDYLKTQWPRVRWE
jgi:inosose dehydratase